MENIINLIEKYRKEKRVRKAELCSYANINVNMYVKYLQGSKVSFKVARDMLECLGKQIVLVDKGSITEI